MTFDEALALRKGDVIRLRRPGRERMRRATVTAKPSIVTSDDTGRRWVVVPFAYSRIELGCEVLGAPDHHAVVPGDEVRLEEE